MEAGSKENEVELEWNWQRWTPGRKGIQDGGGPQLARRGGNICFSPTISIIILEKKCAPVLPLFF